MSRRNSYGYHRYLEWAALGAIILLAAYLRLGNPGIIEFKRDEANLSLLALDLAHGKSFPLLGIGSSVGLPNAPVNVYLLAIPYFFASNPIIATQFIALLNVLAVGLIYGVGRRYSGVIAGLLAALLLAANPWAVMFSRKIWAQNMLLFFVLCVLVTGLVGFVEGRRWAQLMHLPLLAITGQIHYGAFVIIPVSLYLLWYGRAHWHKRTLFLSVVLAALSLVPYLVGLIQANLTSLSAIRAAVAVPDSNGGSSTGVSLEALDGARILIAGMDVHSFVGPSRVDAFLEVVPNLDDMFVIVPLLIGVAVVGYIAQINQLGRQKPVVIALLIGILFPIVSFTTAWTPFYVHYLIPTLGFAFLLLGFGVNHVYCAIRTSFHRRVSILFTGLIVTISVLISLGQAYLTLQMLDFVDTHETPGGFGTPIHYLNEVRTTVLNEEAPVIGQVDGTAIGIDDEATIWTALLYDAPSVRFEDENTFVYPQSRTIILTTSCKVQGSHFMLRPGGGCYTVHWRSGSEASETASLPDDIETARFTNGVEVIGWQWNKAEKCLSLLWTVYEQPVQGVEYQFAVQFLNEQGQHVASGDALSWPRRFWQLDDKIERKFCTDVASDEIEAVRIGMYQFTADGLANSDLINAGGNPAGQTFVLEVP